MNYKRLKTACYTTNISMSVVANVSPLLFLTFRDLYGIDYTLLGLLVLINFCTQLCVDFVFSLFSHKFNIPKTVRFTPVLTVIGFLLFATAPWVFSRHIYLGIAIATFVFSASSGLAEVLMSPLIATIPAENPEREMSKLHSVYAWGVVGVVLFATLFLLVFKATNWQYLIFVFTLIPLVSAILFSRVEIPKMQTPEKTSGGGTFMKDKLLWLSVIAIFLGGAGECTMSQWSSAYLEKVLGIPKVYGDIFGVATFGMALGLGRTLYSKYGKNIENILLLGSIGTVICYLVAGVSNIAILSLFACAFTGFCASMLWPGNLVVASDRFPKGGVFVYALMAAGGDLGASVGPQLVGAITDFVIASENMSAFAQGLGLTLEQLGMKLGILVGGIFPLLGIVVSVLLLQLKKKEKTKEV